MEVPYIAIIALIMVLSAHRLSQIFALRPCERLFESTNNRVNDAILKYVEPLLNDAPYIAI